MITQTGSDMRRMLRSIYWVGDAVMRIMLVVVFGAVLLAISGLWLLAGVALAIVPLLTDGRTSTFPSSRRPRRCG